MSAHEIIHSPSGPMSAVLRMADQVAVTTTRVLITGETGVGKELLARRIHKFSQRAAQAFEAINCAGVTDSILQAEIFGHVRGSFTGAVRDRKGRIEVSHRGTLFLDEVGDMSSNMQSLLLRVIETGIIERVGDEKKQDTKVPVNVRFIAATNRNLEKECELGSFRHDLYHRLNVFPITIPPLRERRTDIPVLLEYFLPAISSNLGMSPVKFDKDANSALLTYYWPGNVRELQNLLERLIIQYPGETVRVEQLPSKITSIDDGLMDARDPDYYVANRLYNQMIREGSTFWETIYEPFMSRDITRSQVKAVVKKGLVRTSGNYKQVAQLFNLEEGEYKRLLNFLRKNECQLDFKEYRKVSQIAAVA